MGGWRDELRDKVQAAGCGPGCGMKFTGSLGKRRTKNCIVLPYYTSPATNSKEGAGVSLELYPLIFEWGSR